MFNDQFVAHRMRAAIFLHLRLDAQIVASCWNGGNRDIIRCFRLRSTTPSLSLP